MYTEQKVPRLEPSPSYLPPLSSFPWLQGPLRLWVPDPSRRARVASRERDLRGFGFSCGIRDRERGRGANSTRYRFGPLWVLVRAEGALRESVVFSRYEVTIR